MCVYANSITKLQAKCCKSYITAIFMSNVTYSLQGCQLTEDKTWLC